MRSFLMVAPVSCKRPIHSHSDTQSKAFWKSIGQNTASHGDDQETKVWHNLA